MFTQACLPLLKSCPGSRLINVTSVASRLPCPGLSVYTATKHALSGFSEVLRLELAKFQVSVVTVQPGDFSKRSYRQGRDDAGNKQAVFDSITAKCSCNCCFCGCRRLQRIFHCSHLQPFWD